MTSTFEFTPEEKAELEARPVGSVVKPLAPESLALRRAISKRQLEFVEKTEWFKARPPKVQELMRKFPFTDFYEDTDTKLARRVYGVIECTDGTLRLHVGTALMMMANDTVGGVDPAILRKIDNFSEKQLFTITTMGRSAAVFLDPLGWQLLLQQRNHLMEAESTKK